MEHRTCKRCAIKKAYIAENFRRKTHICNDCNRADSRARTFKYLRGISYEERDALLAQQGGVCASCGGEDPKSKKGWHVDHDHLSGVIRGVLCANCNIALGHMGDSEERILKLIDYLRKNRTEGATTIPIGSRAKWSEAHSPSQRG